MPAHLRPGELEGRPEDRLGHVGRLGQRPLAGDGLEPRVADLHGDSRCPNAGRPQPAGDAVGHGQQRPLDDLGIDWCRRRTCARGRPTSPGRPRGRVGVDALAPGRPGSRRACRTAAPGGPATARQGRRWCGRRSRRGRPRSSRRRPTGGRSGAAPGTPPPRRARRRPGRRACAGPRRSSPRAWSGATPTDTVSPTSSRTAALILRGDGRAVAEQRLRPRDVEERLVDRDRLDLRREPAQDRHHVARRLLVAPAVDRQEDAIGTASQRLAQ